jgi:hypothetical protein
VVEVAEIKLPEELKHKMELFPEVNWSAVAEEAISEKVQKLALVRVLDKMLEKSELTEGDALRLGEEVKEAGLRELKEKGLL